MAEHRHDFWRLRERRQANATRHAFPHQALRRECREFLSQGKPALSGRLGLSARVRRARLVLDDSGELEFGDVGRDARFLPGWWIFPAFSFGLCILACVVDLFV
jgi:hypothetical protein